MILLKLLPFQSAQQGVIQVSGWNFAGILSLSFFISFFQGIHSIEKLDRSDLCGENGEQNSRDDLTADLKSEFNLQLHESYSPRNMYDILRYEFLTQKHVFDNFDDDPKIRILGHQKNDVKDIVSQTLTLFGHQSAGDWNFVDIIEFYRRLDPQRGEEYSFTLNLTRIKGGNSENGLHQFDVVKPFSQARLLSHKRLDHSSRIYIIVPVFNSSAKFKRFLDNFENVCLKNKLPVVLVVVSFLIDRNSQSNVNHFLVDPLINKYGSRYFRIINTYRTFARGFAKDLAIKELLDDKLLFFCDLDIMFTEDFLRRCRTNAVLKKQVFYPVVFAQYHPKFVKAYAPKEEKSNLKDINKSTGHWVHYGYGIACMYAHDYRVVGGFDLSTRGWGGEDVKLFQKHVASDLKILRAMDPGLIHVYHDKTCDKASLSALQLHMCEDSKAQGLGSRQEIAKHIIAKNCSVSL